MTAVDSAEKVDILRSIGADHVIDYRKEDFTRNGETYDAIIDLVGKNSFSRIMRSLNRNGRYVVGYASIPAMIKRVSTSRRSDKKVILDQAKYSAEDYASLLESIEARKVRAIIDRRYPLEQTAEAHRYVEQGHKKGNIVIAVG